MNAGLRSGRTKASLHDARRSFEQCLAIDPDYARAYVMLSRTHLHAYYEPFDGDYLNPATRDRALELAETAVRVVPSAVSNAGGAVVARYTPKPGMPAS